MILPTLTGGDDTSVDTPTPAPKIDLQAAIRTLFPNGMPGEGPTGPAVEAGATGGSGSPDGWSGRARELVGSVARAVLGHESDDDYTASNKASGDTALGAYQIMDYNVGPWTKQYLGHAMTPAEFAQDKQAQDTVATARLQDYLTKNLAKSNGNVEQAIRLTSYDWYGHNGGRYDSPAYSKKSKSITGPSPNDYADDVIDRYHKIAGSAAADTTASAPADATASGDSSVTGATQAQGQAASSSSTSLPLDPNTPLPSPGQITSSKPQPAAATYFDRMIGNLDQQDDQAEAQQAATAQAQKEEADRQAQDKATQFAQAINHLAGGMQFVPGHGPTGQAPLAATPGLIPAGGLHPIDPGQAKDTRTLKDTKQIPISESAPAKGFAATSGLMSALAGGESEGVVGSLNPAGGLLLHFASLNPATAELTRAGLEGVNALALNIPAATFPESYQQLKDVVSSGNPTADAAADFVGSTGGSLYGISKIEQALAHIAPGASAATRTGLTFAAQNAPDIISKTVDGKLTPLQGLGMLGMGYVEGSLFSKVGDVNKSMIDNSLSTGEQKAVQAFQGGVLQAPVSVATEFAKKGISGEKITGTDIAQSAGFGAAFGAMQGAHVEGEHNSDPLAAKIDEKAHEAATSPMNDRPEPTVAQKNAGNYKMGHVTMQGLDISIENPAGSERSGNGPDGPWSVTMKNHYGYIKGTEGADGDHVDTFIGPNPKSDKVFVVDQVDASKPNADDATGAYAGRAFDEHKVILGANTRGEALKIYRDNYSDDATARIGAVSETNIGDFKEWLKSGDKSQPFNSEMRAEGPVPTVRDGPDGSQGFGLDPTHGIDWKNAPLYKGKKVVGAIERSLNADSNLTDEQRSNVTNFVKLLPSKLVDKLNLRVLHGDPALSSYQDGELRLQTGEPAADGASPDEIIIHELWHALSPYVHDKAIGDLSRQHADEDQKFHEANPHYYSMPLLDGTMSAEDASGFRKEFPDQAHRLYDAGDGEFGMDMTRDEHKALHPEEWFAESMKDHTLAHMRGQAVEGSAIDATFQQVMRGDIRASATDAAGERIGNANLDVPSDNSQASQERPGIPLYSEGREQQLRLANGEKKPVRYALAESDDVQLSHNEQTFEPNEKYAGENQNNYHDDPAQQAVVVEGGHDTDWNIIHSTTSSAIEGPTFVDPFGMAAGGNGRGMMVKRAYAERPEETKAQVVKDAENFGLDPSVAEGMQKPMVVRVQPDVVTRDAESARNIADLNQTNTKQRTPTVEGVYLAKRLNDQNRTQLAEAMTSIDNMSELTQSANKARPVINMLREVGQITKANQNEYISSDGTLTPKGRETVEGLSLGMALPDAQLIGRLPDSFRQKMVENLRPIGAAEAIKGWELHDNFARIADYAEARKRYIEQGGVKEQYDNQASLLPDESRPQLNSEDRLLLGLLDDPKRTRFRDFMQSYAQNAAIGREGAIDIMGDTMTRDRAFANARDAFASGSYRPSSSNGASTSGAARRGAIDTPLGEGSRPMPEADAKETMSDDAPRTPEEEQTAKDPVTGQDESRFRMPSAVEATASEYQKARAEILKVFAPQRTSPEARRTANMLRKSIAERKRMWDIAFTTLQDAEAEMDRAIGAAGGPEKGFTAGYDFTDRHERGLTQSNAVLQNASEVLKAEYDGLWDEMHATGRLDAYVENYLSRNWDRSRPGDEQRIASFNRTRSLEGSKTFLRQRIFEYQSDGINFGLRPQDPNPIRSQYGAIQQMHKFIMAHKMWEQEAAYGTPKFIPAGEPDPEGYGSVDDSIAKVFAPNSIEVKEGFDRKMMQGLEQFATGLGFTHERVASLRGGKWGYAEKPGPDGRGHIVTRFAGPESALAHEIGHEVDWKYGMMKSMNGKPYIDRELSALAKERYSGNETLVSDAVKREADTSDERAATMFEAYVHAPELFKQTAPHAFAEFEKFLDAHPELSSFKEIKPSLVMGERTQSVTVGGRREMGRWVLPQGSADVINNFKSKSWRETSSIAKGVLDANFLAAGFRLSFSWFHGPFTGINQVVTRVAASMYDGFNGRAKESARNFAHAIVAPYADTKLGLQIGQEWRSPGMHPELADAVDRQIEGGGRDKMDSHVSFDAIRRLKIASRQKDFRGVGKEAFGSAVQAWMYPIMEGLVPAAKHTSRLVIGNAFLRDLPEGASIEDQRAALAKADDYTDAIFGQVTYANGFMDNKWKDVLFGLTQSLGWTKGSYTMFAGAIRDTGKFAYDAARAPFTHEAPKVTFPMTYAASLFAVHGLLSGMITLACTGAMPTETKDYFFPTIGRNRDGTKRRIALPTYVTVIAGLEQGGMKSIINATAYAPQMFAQLYNNRDYNNEKIYNSDDPFYTRVYDAARHVLTEGVEPYSVKNIAKLFAGDDRGQKSSLWEKLGPLMGVKTAPFYVTRTPAESLAWEYLADSRPAGGYDKSQSARFEERKALRAELRDDRTQGMADLKDAQDKGLIKKGAASRSVIRSSQRTWLENVMDGMDFNKGANLYEIGNDDEKRHLGPQLEKKYHTALRDAGNPEDRARISERYTKLVGGNAIVAPNVTSSSGENASSEMIIH